MLKKVNEPLIKKEEIMKQASLYTGKHYKLKFLQNKESNA